MNTRMLAEFFKNQMRRRLILLLCCAGLVGGMGCVSMWANDGHRKRQNEYHRAPVLADTIVAFGQPDAEFMKHAGTNEVIALLGTNRTYVLVEGAAQLTNIAAKISSPQLQMQTYRSLYRKGDVVWGTITVTVPAGTNVVIRMNDGGLHYTLGGTNAEPPADLAKVLTELGFQPEFTTVAEPHVKSFEIYPVRERSVYAYSLRIPVKGVMRPAVKLDAAATTKVQRTYSFALYNPPESEPPPDVGYWLVKMPLAVVADVALSPVYILGALVLVITVPFM